MVEFNGLEHSADAREAYFKSIAEKYEVTGMITDSKIRLDQETAIAEDLREHKSVLVRGYWRAGKSSLMRSTLNHSFGKGEAIVFGEQNFSDAAKLPVEDFKRNFGSNEILDFLEKAGMSDDELEQKVRYEGKQPIELLLSYLETENKTLYLGLDEIVQANNRDDILEFVAGLSKQERIVLVIVLHQVDEYEEKFQRIFGEDFSTYFARPLTDAEVNVLIEQPLANTQIDFSDGAKQAIKQVSGSRPYEVNIVCRALLEPASPFFLNKHSITEENIRELAKKPTMELIKYEPFNVLIQRTYLKIYGQAINSEQRNVITSLAEGKTLKMGEVDDALIQPLLDSTMVQLQNDCYVVGGELFKNALEYIRGSLQE